MVQSDDYISNNVDDAPALLSRRRRRRRRAPVTATTATAASVAALVLFTGGRSASVAADDTTQQQQRRQLFEQNKHDTLSKWRSLSQSSTGAASGEGVYDYSKVRPLDYVLDETSPPGGSHTRAFQKGAGGFLEPIDEYNYQEDFLGKLLFTSGGEIVSATPASSTLSSEGGGSNGGQGGDGAEGDSILEEVVVGGGQHIINEGDDMDHQHYHIQSSRLSLTNFDHARGIGLANDLLDDEYEISTERERRDTEEEEGRRQVRGRGLLRGGVSSAMNTEGREPQQQRGRTLFRYTAENDPHELEGYEIIPEEELQPFNTEQERGRRLQALSFHSKSSQGGVGYGSSNNASSSSSSQQSSSSSNSDIEAYRRNSNNNNNSNANSNNGNSNYDRTPPIIRATFPPAQVSIGSLQTFGALVSDNHVGSSGIRKVCLQFKDHMGLRSDCFELRNVNNNNEGNNKRKGGRNPSSNTNNSGATDIYELSFEGFGVFAGKEWSYRIKSIDGARNKKFTQWRMFKIDESAGNNALGDGIADPEDNEEVEEEKEGVEEKEEEEGTQAAPPAPPTKEPELLVEEVKDSNWPYNGVVQYSTGRIMFFFDNNPYVCTGTVLADTPRDRTVIVTAGHCAYQYRPGHAGGGRFAEHALFIPNQVDTRGLRSNDVCTDDPLGCWIPAFAVVDYEWTKRSFPDSVPWDYAYYVIPNDPTAHEGGFIHADQVNLSKILDDLVEPLPIDFNWRLETSSTNHLGTTVPGEFTHGLGYSFNKDPAFRYCASHMSTKYGISSYENLWLDVCEMTGGSSGGPWMKDVDDSGRGTVISVNSWGYSSTPGMAGPNFNTQEGGKAECLFEKAKSARFEEVVGRGIVVDDCG